MEFKDKYFYTKRATDLIQFAEFVGSLEALSLRDEIKDEKDNILIQAKRPLRVTLLNALMSRGNAEFDLYVENSTAFEAIMNERIVKEIATRTNLAEFSFAAYLLDKQRVNISRIVTGAMKNDFFRGTLALLLYNNKPIVEHLFEVALTSLGLLANVRKENAQVVDLVRIFQAGILHDFAISESPMWHLEEDFAEPNGHDRQSAKLISGNELDDALPEMIQANNQLKNKQFNDASKDEDWFTNTTSLSAVIINLAEYLTFIKREVGEHGAVEDPMTQVTYQLALATEKGSFPKRLMTYFEEYFANYTEFFRYGQEIGAIENTCPHGLYALAYPKPKSTQVLCKNSEVPCEFRVTGKAIDVVQAQNELTNRLGETLIPGWYDKCQFTERLPNPPEKF